MKIKHYDIKNAAKLHALSGIMHKGDEAYRQAVNIQNDSNRYFYKQLPTKIVFNNTEYTGMASIATIAALIGFKPYNIYQKMRRDEGHFILASVSKGIYIQMDKELDIQKNNIDDFFKNV